MKKHITYLFLLPMFLFSASLRAKAEVNNYLGAYAQLSEWSLLPSGNPDYSHSLGFGGSLGGVYEMQAGPTYSPTRFLMDIGVGFQGGMTSYQQSTDMTKTLYGQTTISGKPFDYVYEVQGRNDWYRDIAVGIPVLFGVQHKKFYLLAGVKGYYHLLTNTVSTATVNTYGQMEGLDPFRDMPQYQFFEGEKVKGDPVKTKFTFDLDLSLEIGGRIGYVTNATGYDVPERRVEYRLAAFLDYGLFDIRHADAKNIYPGSNAAFDPANSLETPSSYDNDINSPGYVYNQRTMVDGLVMRDIMSVDNFASRVSNMMVGLKFTVLFQMPKSGPCVMCRDNYIRTAKSGVRAGVKYEE